MIEPRTSLIKFAAELFNIKTEFVQCIVLTRADKREKLIMELRKADFNGVKIWSKMDTKPKVNLNQNWWEFVLDMPFDTEFGGTNSVVELNKQINDDFRPNLSNTDQSDRQAQDLARTAAEAMHELANHIRQQNPDLATMFFAIEAALTEVCQNRWHK
ncbi:hypothetical protein niasHS_015698 [Heterodera schachtii]|uniref:Uncharacterized protein n=1 Tax=Heterodera schachtii TaxID=97005 RepID=A0ABD2HSB8_HETSC